MLHTVHVWDKPYEVRTRQQSKTTWVAAGDHRGKFLRVEARSEAQALSAWCERAKYEEEAPPERG